MSEFQEGLPQLQLPTIKIKPSVDEIPTIHTPKSGSNSNSTDDDCCTPTSPKHKIPVMLSCPPAPKKSRRTEHFNSGSVSVVKRRLGDFLRKYFLSVSKSLADPHKVYDFFMGLKKKQEAK